MSSGVGIIALVLCNYALSVCDIHIHPLCLAGWVALEGYLTAKDNRRPGFLLFAIYVSRPKKKQMFQ